MRWRSNPTENGDQLESKLASVVDPVLFHTLGELGSISRLDKGRNGTVVHIAVPTDAYPQRSELEARIAAAVAPDEGVSIELDPMDETGRTALGARLRELQGPIEEAPAGNQPGAQARANPFAGRSKTRVIAIASGKGGVGKSSVTVNLSIALAALGHTVGLLDADIYGFSVPRMLGVDAPPIVAGNTMIPPVIHGVRCMSAGYFVDEDQAVAWRGPMLHKALEQFLVDVHWGAPEFLVVDMPPGTGDVALSVGQQLPASELLIVTTPQPAAERVAQRAGALARQLRLPLRGVIENMSYFVGNDGTRYELFGRGGGAGLAKNLDVPLLAQIPFVEALREGGDVGMPITVADPAGEIGMAFAELAKSVAALGPVRVYRKELTIS